MQDTYRYLIILIAINILMGTAQILMHENTYDTSYGLNELDVGDDVRRVLDDQIHSSEYSPTSYQSQTSLGSETELSKNWAEILLHGLKPVPIPLNGYENLFEEQLYKLIANIRFFLMIMTGLLVYQLIRGRTT